MKKICLITCYSQPDYVRARTLRTTFTAMNDVQLIVVKNKHKGWLRYPEVILKVIAARVKHRPDIYFQTFRAYETFPLVRLVSLGKPFIYDEFINPIELVVHEHGFLKTGGMAAKLAGIGYRFWLKMVSVIVTDTPSHAQFSAEIMRLPLDKYIPLIVSTDEDIFTVRPKAHVHANAPFTVFYYGLLMRPLQGLDTMIEAMRLLKNENVQLVLIGGKGKTEQRVKAAQLEGVPIDYKRFVDYRQLPQYMQNADVCLAGPFGGTVQARFVIGGKTYQYLNMGRPVIIGKNEESDIWTNKKDALIVPQADPQALADAILWAKAHPDELETIGKNGKRLYDEKLSNVALSRQLRTLLADERLA